jgi:hypothetical protein
MGKTREMSVYHEKATRDGAFTGMLGCEKQAV